MTQPTSEDRIGQTAYHVVTALSACLKDAEGKGRPYYGEIKCPACDGILHYVAKTSARGTIWGECETSDCLRWMV